MKEANDGSKKDLRAELLLLLFRPVDDGAEMYRFEEAPKITQFLIDFTRHLGYV